MVLPERERPSFKFDLGKLEYNDISKIVVGNQYNFSCQDLGSWYRKIKLTYDLADGYYWGDLDHTDIDRKLGGKYFYCFGAYWQNSINKHIVRAEEYYTQNNLEISKKKYLDALLLNPWSLKALSGLSLVNYKLSEACEGYLVARSAEKQTNGSKALISSLHFNAYLNLRKLGQIEKAKESLTKSIEFRTTEAKYRLLSELNYLPPIQKVTCDNSSMVERIRDNLTRNVSFDI